MNNRPQTRQITSGTQDINLCAEITEMRTTLEFVSAKLDVITRLQKDLETATQAIAKLQQENKQKEENIMTLESRVDELEQYSKNDNIVITGLNVHYRSVAGAVSSTMQDYDNITDSELESLETQVISYLNSNIGTEICPADISACHTLKSKKTTKDIILQVVNRKTKFSRDLRKQKKIASTWTREGKIFIKTNGTPEVSKIHAIRDMEDSRKLRLI